MKILFLSENMSSYGAAHYQQDLMDTFARQAQVTFWGKGFENYDKSLSIEQIVKKLNLSPDVIVVGHTWLIDTPDEPVDQFPNLKIDETDIPKVGILNKEYLKLDAKLDYFRKNKFLMVFSHHHDADLFSDRMGLPCYFSPFAFNDSIFYDDNREKKYDFTFKGILQNQNKGAQQGDIRVQVLNRFYVSILDIPVFRRKKYSSRSIYWNAIPRGKIGQKIASKTGIFSHLPIPDYAELLRESKIVLNSFSPMQLISPRFFESLASGALVFCPESELYNKIFKKDVLVQFSPDFKGFDEQLDFWLDNEQKRKEQTSINKEYVLQNHTWSKRVEEMLQKIREAVNK